MSSVIIWPWWVRLSHWLVATGVVLLWILVYGYYESDQLHRWLGYGLTAIVALRIAAGCYTRLPAARFNLPCVAELLLHIQHIRQGLLSKQHGHNPLGMLAVYWLWACIAVLAITGWLSRTDWLWGEDWPVDIHACFSYLLMASVLLHLFAIFVVSRLARQHLIVQMLDGKLHAFKEKPSKHSPSK